MLLLAGTERVRGHCCGTWYGWQGLVDMDKGIFIWGQSGWIRWNTMRLREGEKERFWWGGGVWEMGLLPGGDFGI